MEAQGASLPVWIQHHSQVQQREELAVRRRSSSRPLVCPRGFEPGLSSGPAFTRTRLLLLLLAGFLPFLLVAIGTSPAIFYSKTNKY